MNINAPKARTPQPSTVRVLRNLIAEARSNGLDAIPVADLEAAVDKVEHASGVKA